METIQWLFFLYRPFTIRKHQTRRGLMTKIPIIQETEC